MSATETAVQVPPWFAGMDFHHAVPRSGDGSPYCGAERNDREPCGPYRGEAICPECGRPMCPRCAQLWTLEGAIRGGAA